MKKSEFGGIKYINKYCSIEKNEENNMWDFPQFKKDAPDGFSIFMSLKENVN